jgi:xylulokinase
VCGLLDGLDALVARCGIEPPQSLALVGGGARSAAYRHILADLSGLGVTVLDDAAEPVAAGACLQAAACLQKRTALQVAKGWTTRRSSVIEPTEVDAASVRSRYVALRE